MKDIFRGRSWVFGNNVDTGTIISARFLTGTDNSDIGRYCLVDSRPEFPTDAKPNDILVAGKNFGCGSSREHAPIAVKQRVRVVVAESFARIFFRNAVNIGLYVVELPDASSRITDGDEVEVDLERGIVTNLTRDETWNVAPMPGFMKDIYSNNGLYGYIKSKMEARKAVGE